MNAALLGLYRYSRDDGGARQSNDAMMDFDVFGEMRGRRADTKDDAKPAER